MSAIFNGLKTNVISFELTSIKCQYNIKINKYGAEIWINQKHGGLEPGHNDQIIFVGLISWYMYQQIHIYL